MFMIRQTPKIEISGQHAAAGVVANTALQPGSLDIYIMYVYMTIYNSLYTTVCTGEVRWEVGEGGGGGIAQAALTPNTG